MESMAIEVLLNVDHTYRHGLKSFFDVLIWQCPRRGWGEEWPKDTLLTKWGTGSYREIAHAKRGDMGVDGFEDILEEFAPHFDWVKPLCKELRGILFPYREGVFVNTPKDRRFCMTGSSKRLTRLLMMAKLRKNRQVFAVLYLLVATLQCRRRQALSRNLGVE
jgi:hypothetical protein